MYVDKSNITQNCGDFVLSLLACDGSKPSKLFHKNENLFKDLSIYQPLETNLQILDHYHSEIYVSIFMHRSNSLSITFKKKVQYVRSFISTAL